MLFSHAPILNEYQLLSSNILWSNPCREGLYSKKEYLFKVKLSPSKMIRKIPKLKIVTFF
jgi:hypothetical protein